MSAHPLAEYRCHALTHLKKQPRADEAQSLVKRLAEQAQPIMAKYKWKVGVLAEFMPKSDNLLGLNMNRGAKIQIRLRLPKDPGTFYAWNHLLGTMLHELVHCKIGAHSAEFYALLDELWTEAEALMDKGITGAAGVPFLEAGKGHRAGGDAVASVPRARVRGAAAAAAEKRARNGKLAAGSGQRLGGAGAGGGTSTADLRQAALAAAERRRQDDLWCSAAADRHAMSRAASTHGGGGGGGGGDVDGGGGGGGGSGGSSGSGGGSGGSGGSSGSSGGGASNSAASSTGRRTRRPEALKRSAALGASGLGTSAKRPRARTAPAPAALASMDSVGAASAAAVICLSDDGEAGASARGLVHSPPPADGMGGEWECGACTFLNQPLALQCLCGALRTQ